MEDKSETTVVAGVGAYGATSSVVQKSRNELPRKRYYEIRDSCEATAFQNGGGMEFYEEANDEGGWYSEGKERKGEKARSAFLQQARNGFARALFSCSKGGKTSGRGLSKADAAAAARGVFLVSVGVDLYDVDVCDVQTSVRVFSAWAKPACLDLEMRMHHREKMFMTEKFADVGFNFSSTWGIFLRGGGEEGRWTCVLDDASGGGRKDRRRDVPPAH